MQIIKKNDCWVVDVELGRTGGTKILLSGDRHFDSVGSLAGEEKRHLEVCKDNGYGIIDFGDLFDAMQTRNDPRRSAKEGIGNDREDYLDFLVEEAATRYSPYAPNFLGCIQGNHEAVIKKVCGTDLTSRFAQKMRDKGGNTVSMPYAGFLAICIRRKTTGYDRTRRFVGGYSHGSGGNAAVTRGVIKTNRRQVELGNFDFFISAHTHKSWQVPIPYVYIDKVYREKIGVVKHISLPTYKWKTGSFFEQKNELSIPNIGAIFLSIDYDSEKDDYKIKFEEA